MSARLSRRPICEERSTWAAAVHPGNFYSANEIELLTSTTVSSLDPVHKRMTLEPGG